MHSPKPAWPAFFADGLWDSVRTTQHIKAAPAKWTERFVIVKSKNIRNCKSDSLKLQDLTSTPWMIFTPLCSVQPSIVLFSYFKPSSDVKAFETTSFISLILSKSTLYFQISVPLTPFMPFPRMHFKEYSWSLPSFDPACAILHFQLFYPV